jgi:hypothetical protein
MVSGPPRRLVPTEEQPDSRNRIEPVGAAFPNVVKFAAALARVCVNTERLAADRAGVACALH